MNTEVVLFTSAIRGTLARAGYSLLAFAIGAAPAAAASYPALDGLAEVVIDQPNAGSCEIVVNFSERSKPILKLNFVSEDHEHRACLGEAAWTANSRFFVFGIEYSGGPQSWHAPIMIYFRHEKLAKPLERFLGDPTTEAVTDPHFVLSSDTIEFTTTRLGPIFDQTEPRRRSTDLQSLQP